MDFQGDQYKKKKEKKFQGGTVNLTGNQGVNFKEIDILNRGGWVQFFFWKSPILTQKLPGKTIWELVTNLLLQLPQFQIVTEFVTGIWLRNLFSEKVFYMKLNSKQSLTER